MDTDERGIAMDLDPECFPTEILIRGSQKALRAGFTEEGMLLGIGWAILAIASEMKRANDLAEREKPPEKIKPDESGIRSIIPGH